MHVVPPRLEHVRHGRHHRRVQPAAARLRRRLKAQRAGDVVVPKNLLTLLVHLFEPKRVRELKQRVAQEVDVLPVPVRFAFEREPEGRSIRANVGVEFKGVSWS
eukprot:31490-Pelagococcus_subviridis.AAC.19